MFKIHKAFAKQQKSLGSTLTKLNFQGTELSFHNLNKLADPRADRLPFSIRVLLENCLRNRDGFVFTDTTTECVLDWKRTSALSREVPFKPARVLLQDFTGVPAVVDLAAMRDVVQRLGGDPRVINPLCPVDLVVDHSVQVDVARSLDAKEQNQRIEFARNRDRFQFLKWGARAFQNFRIVPPGNGIVHQVNLEHLARVVFSGGGVLYPDSVVGTDSHTTMINGLGVVGWGVGGIEAEAVMLGQHISMVLPEVVGFRLAGRLRPTVTATDLVLTITQMLRQRGVVGKFVEFFGDGVESLSVEDRATVANMAPEYGATIGVFPVDLKTLDYLRRTGRSEDSVALVHEYCRRNMLLRDYRASNDDGVEFSGAVLELELGAVEPCVAGPKRPHDRVPLSAMQQDFRNCLAAPLGFKGFGLKADQPKSAEFAFEGKTYTLKHGDVVISAITSCTNTSNPGVLVAAGILARNALARGLKVAPYVKTSLSPGSGVVEAYLRAAGLLGPLEQLGFTIAGLGCMTCIGNSGELDPALSKAVKESELVVGAVLSGNRNFEGRVHPLTKANYLASPPLCVAYALAGTLDIDFERQPLGAGSAGEPVFLREIWPAQGEVAEAIAGAVTSKMFQENYHELDRTNKLWNELAVPEATTYAWDAQNSYIKNPPFFADLQLEPRPVSDIKGAYCLLVLGDSITTDHISPAGKIAGDSPAARYLRAQGIEGKDFNTYGARRGNFEVMARGTFANIRLVNKMVANVGPRTVHVPSGEERAIFEVAEMYMRERRDTIILAGQEYGAGSSRDWAAKGPFLQGVRAVIAQSFERIHRSNLVGMGVLPLEFLKGQSAETLGLTGRERFTIPLEGGRLSCRDIITVSVDNGKTFSVMARIDTPIEIEYFRHGGILQYVLRNLLKQKP